MQCPAKFRNAAGQYVVGYEGVGPNRANQLLFGNDLAALLSQAKQHFHHLGLEVSGRTVTEDGVEVRLNDTRADFEGGGQTGLQRYVARLYPRLTRNVDGAGMSCGGASLGKTSS